MSAAIFEFSHHPIRVVRDEGAWLVLWPGWAWSHASSAAARADAHKIAAAHGERVIDYGCDERRGGAA